ncbi:MAG: hypothetical protein WCK76_05035 [Elusimicrobiota bacterium]
MTRLFAILTLLAAVPAAALDFDRPAKENGAFYSELAAPAPKAEQQVIGGAGLLELLAARDAASKVVDINGQDFLVTPAFDAGWNVYFSIKPRGTVGYAGVWKEELLKEGVNYAYAGTKVAIKDEDGAIKLAWQGGSAETSMAELFDLLYSSSASVTFGDAVTYALIRNLEPLTEKEGTVTMRQGSDGLYYYSLTQDSEIEAAPRWLLAVNGVLYGLRIEDASLQFIAKQIEMRPEPLLPERALKH